MLNSTGDRFQPWQTPIAVGKTSPIWFLKRTEIVSPCTALQWFHATLIVIQMLLSYLAISFFFNSVVVHAVFRFSFRTRKICECHDNRSIYIYTTICKYSTRTRFFCLSSTHSHTFPFVSPQMSGLSVTSHVGFSTMATKWSNTETEFSPNYWSWTQMLEQFNCQFLFLYLFCLLICQVID